MTEPLEPQNHVLPPKPELGATESSKVLQPAKLVVLADLNVDPPEADEDDSPHVPPPEITRFNPPFCSF